MSNAPNTDKWLHADGSVTTMAGIPILPAEQNRAEEYQSRAAAVDKWLHEDGSVTDSAGRDILPPDERRAQDYASRSAGIGGVFLDGGGSNSGAGFSIQDAADLHFAGAISEQEDFVTLAAQIGDAVVFQLFPNIRTGETVADMIMMGDTAAVALS